MASERPWANFAQAVDPETRKTNRIDVHASIVVSLRHECRIDANTNVKCTMESFTNSSELF